MKEFFNKLANSRKSVNSFIENETINQEDLDEIFKVTQLAPSCFNLQHTSYIVIINLEKRQQFYKEVCNQYKVLAASAVVMVLGDIDAYKKAFVLKEDSKNVELVEQFYEKNIPTFCRDEAIRNASLSAMNFIYAAKSIGYDTCPMMGFNIKKAKDFFNLPTNLEPVLLIAIGKEDQNKPKIRESRKDLTELYKIW